MDSYQDENFPVHIDLGRKVPDYSGDIASPTTVSKAKKTRTVYPSLYFDDIPADLFAKLKKTGWALIEYRRRRISIEDNPNAEKKKDEDSETASGSVDVLQICLPEEDGDLAEELAAFAKKSGVDTEGIGNYKDDGDGDNDEDDSEEEDEE